MTTTPKTLNIDNYHVASVRKSDKTYDMYKGNPAYSCVTVGQTNHYYDIDSSFSDYDEFRAMVESKFGERVTEVFVTSKGCWWCK